MPYKDKRDLYDAQKRYREREKNKIRELKQRLHEIEVFFGVNYEYEVV